MFRHQAYFTNQHPVIPLLHPGRYMQAFYSAPHLRPPMALQYAVWTMATLGIDKYSHYHHAFHRRCRHYLEEDELKVRKFCLGILFSPLLILVLGRRRAFPHCSSCTSVGIDSHRRSTQYVVHASRHEHGSMHQTASHDGTAQA